MTLKNPLSVIALNALVNLVLKSDQPDVGSPRLCEKTVELLTLLKLDHHPVFPNFLP